MPTLDKKQITSVPNGEEANASHLKNGMYVAITEAGLNDHNSHNMWNTIGVCSSIGLVSLPVIIGGGIGLAMGGEAIGLGLAELGIVGGFTGATVGKIVDKPKTGHVVDGKHETLSLVDMVGVVVNRSRRWWDQPGHDIEVKWYAKDAQGRPTTFRAWHNPEHLYGLK